MGSYTSPVISIGSRLECPSRFAICSGVSSGFGSTVTRLRMLFSFKPRESWVRATPVEATKPRSVVRLANGSASILAASSPSVKAGDDRGCYAAGRQ
ncbi:hypothetical protein L917_07153 [Phytophthora nicotianae]|uniref:Uncharacterized protein n=1 Tax=Phytophthora nicotianae TaxID=4792 RepID=W2NJU4_PHYNI|nr:hypothetical protein L916_07262 [Phytophthora nicotianae]ETL94977.1 hypothetical protein L917_07153 [Phytophthora nicotianae]ETM48213.1 hypothetical protein L914_07210 [Phytophthora nicotianae]